MDSYFPQFYASGLDMTRASVWMCTVPVFKSQFLSPITFFQSLNKEKLTYDGKEKLMTSYGLFVAGRRRPDMVILGPPISGVCF